MSTPPKTQLQFTYIVCLPSLFFLLFSAPPKNEAELITTLTSSGTIISIPPNTALQLIRTSSLILTFLKSQSTPPNTAVKVVPLNSSLSNDTFYPLKTATCSPSVFLLTFSLILFLNIIENPNTINTIGNNNFQNKL